MKAKLVAPLLLIAASLAFATGYILPSCLFLTAAIYYHYLRPGKEQ